MLLDRCKMHRNDIYMEGSVDSIGSCSLDVNADTTTDFSDASSNYIVPELSRESKNRILCVDETDRFGLIETNFTDCLKVTPQKKPSYLNLACCVNGYSNATKYDSIFRQNISSLSPSFTQPRPIISGNLKDTIELNLRMDGFDTTDKISSSNFDVINIAQKNTNDMKRDTKSFVQQRVERLYGKEAIAKGIYSPKSKDALGKFDPTMRQKTNFVISDTTESSNGTRNDLDLPVFRHLRPEFRAQLNPIISPKKDMKTNVNGTGEVSPRYITASKIALQSNAADNNNVTTKDSMCIKPKTGISEETSSCDKICDNPPNKDGHHFLNLLSIERNRLLDLAKEAEILLETLPKNGDISEDVFGFLRAASGKARLLATKKMKQFEGLCMNNLNSSPNEKFPTTVEDLQGFWDMVHLQIDNIDLQFKEIQEMKANNWQELRKETTRQSVLTTNTKRIASKPTKANNKPSDPETESAAQKRAAASALAAKKRELQRKQLMELRKKHKQALTEQQEQQQNAIDTIDEKPIEVLIKNSNST